MNRIELPTQPFSATRYDRCRRSWLALEWFVGSATLLAVGVGGGWLLAAVIRQLGLDFAAAPRWLFAVNLLALAGISWQLHRAVWFVRWEKQSRFRLAGLHALAGSLLFLIVQTAALRLASGQITLDFSSDGPPMMIALLAGHLLHTTVAVLFLVHVLQHAARDRYDHEYHWGVTVCATFWHVLGLAYLPLLLFALAVL